MMIVLLRRRFWFLAKNESGQQFQRGVIWRFAEGMTPYNSPTQGRGISKGKYKPKLEFLEGFRVWGLTPKNLHGGLKQYFLEYISENTHVTILGCYTCTCSTFTHVYQFMLCKVLGNRRKTGEIFFIPFIPNIFFLTEWVYIIMHKKE